MLKKFLFPFFLFVCLFSSQVHAAFFDPKAEVYTLKTEHFTIHYPVELATVAEDFVEISEKVYAKLTPKFNWQPWGRTHVVLTDQTDSANGFTFVIPANYVLLFVTPPDADSSLDNYKNYLEMLFTHEFSHVLHLDQHYRVADPFHWLFGKIVAPNGLTPGWMREGLAVYVETNEAGKGRAQFSISDMMIRAALEDKAFPHIDEIDAGRIKWPGGEAQYIYGAKFLQWLANKYGEERLYKYAQEYASGVWIFSLNNKARRIFGKSFYKLWADWKADLEPQYQKLKNDLLAKGLTPLEALFPKDKANFSYPVFNPKNGLKAYARFSKDDGDSILVETTDGAKPKKINRSAVGQLAFSHDGKLLALASVSQVEKYRAYTEVFVYDIEKDTLARLYEKDFPKKSLRAKDPDFSSEDGGNRWLVMVRTDRGTDNLYVFDRLRKHGYFITDSKKYTQFSNPRYSSDGEAIAVSQRESDGNRDIIVLSKTGEFLYSVTSDQAIDNYPIYAKGALYFESDRTGISNIFRFDPVSKETTQVTNVLTGAFQPAFNSKGEMLVQYYTSKGASLYKVEKGTYASVESVKSPLDPPFFKGGEDPAFPPLQKGDQGGFSPLFTAAAHVEIPPGAEGWLPNADKKEDEVGKGSEKIEETSYERALKQNTKNIQAPVSKPLAGSKKYRAFPQILAPRYLQPTFSTLDDAVIFGFYTGRFDPLYRHNWSAYADYRTDAGFIGGGGTYYYTRYKPTFFTGFARYALNWGDLFATGDDFFEERLQGYLGASVNYGYHTLTGSYFYEDRDNISTIPATFSARLVNLDTYAGLRTSYVYARYKTFPYSISQENGPLLKLNFDITDSLFGAAQANEQRIFTGDFRYYFEMPYSDHHVLGLRAAGGYVWGDQEQLLNGTLRFGGPFGEGMLAGVSPRLVTFRGVPGVLFSRDRVMLMSAEYRLPLANIERGIGTWPVNLQKIYLAFFTDYGDAWFRNEKENDGKSFLDDFLLSVGAELKGDFVLGYGLPVTGRFGYGIVVNNRDRILGLTDSLTGMDVQNGVFYLQFGTSF